MDYGTFAAPRPNAAAPRVLAVERREASLALRMERRLASAPGALATESELTRPEPALPRSPKPATSEATEAYRDALIDETLAGEDDGISLEDRERGPQPLGQRQYFVEYRHMWRGSNGAQSTEKGLALHYQRETRDYGELLVQAQVRENEEPASLTLASPEARHGTLFTAQQFQFPLTSELLMDNGAGLLRTTPEAFLGAPYRFQLPGSLFTGVQSRVYGADAEARAYAGSLATLSGNFTPTQKHLEGDIAGAGYSRRFSATLAGGADIVALNGHAAVPDHQSLAWTLRYTPVGGSRWAVNGLADSKGANGLWGDFFTPAGFWTHRVGAFRMEPRLLWSDVPVASDQRGAYARSEYRTQLNQLAIGADAIDTNLRRDPAVTGTRSLNAYASGFTRVTRETYLTGSYALADRNIRNSPSADAESSRTHRVNVGATQRLPWGPASLRLFAASSEADRGWAKEQGATWDQDWGRVAQRFGLSTAATRAREERAALNLDRTTLAALFRSEISGPLSGDGSVQYNRIRASDGTLAETKSASMSVVWALSRNWSARAQVLWNRLDLETPGQPLLSRDKIVFIALRYAEAEGLPYVPQGRETGAKGLGGIVGWIFYDDNNDGVRQASERGAAGVLVTLDGRQTASTDQEGRFEFSAVRVGAHSLTLAVERVPLPWGLQDEGPRRVEVPLRDAARLDVPLTRIAP